MRNAIRTVLLQLGVLGVLGGPWAVPARAGAWLREPGGWYLKSTALLHSTAERWDCTGRSVAAEPFGGRYRERQVHNYLEWGATDRLTLIGSLGFKDARIEGARVPTYGTRSTTDLRVGARVGLLQTSWPVSVEIVASVPTYERTDPSAPIGARAQYLPAGSGGLESEVRALLGRSLHPLPLYVNLDAGHRSRGGSFGDQWILAAEVGGAWDRAFGKLEIRGTLPTGELCASPVAGAVSLHDRAWRFAPELAVRVSRRTWVGFGAAVPFAARNALQGVQLAFSLSWQVPGAR